MKTFSNSKSKLTKVAIIGTGNMGKHRARVYSVLKRVNLVAVSDINEKKGKKIAAEFNCKYYKDYNQMLKKEDIDVVSASVPTKLHKKVALDVIKHKKHLMIEKPIAQNSKEAKEIIKAAEKAKVKLAVSHVERFNPAIQRLKKKIEKGKLGKITSIIIRRVGIFPPHPIADPNVIMGLVIHDLDILNYLLNNQQPIEVFAKGRKILTNRGEDSAEVFLSYNGITSFIQVNWITPGKIRTISITGSKNYAELNCLTQKLEIYKANHKRKIGGFKEFMRYGQSVKKEIKIRKKEPLFCELESFVKCIKENKKPWVTGEDGLKALIIVEKTLKSLKYNKVIKL